MYKKRWLSWFLLCLFLLISNLQVPQSWHVKASQRDVQEEQRLNTIHLLLQDEASQRIIQQNIQMLTILLLTDEPTTRNQVFLPLVIR